MSEYESIEKKIYQVTHRSSGEKRIVASVAAQNACAGCGWMVGDCHVYEIPGQRPHAPQGDNRLMVKVPCSVCSFQWAECKLPSGENCPCKPEVPDIYEWFRQVTKAHLCAHVGVDLVSKDHQLHQKWLPMEEAIKELSVK